MWLIIIVLVAVALVAAVVVGLERRRSLTLRRRFGPEYDRVVEDRGGRRAGEAQLRELQRRRDELELTELAPEEAARARARWTDIQARFVDEPTDALTDAAALVEEVLRHRGYPVDDPDGHVDMVVVDHPTLADDYRYARSIRRRADGQVVPTDDVREAFLRYRALFAALVGSGDAATTADACDDTPGTDHAERPEAAGTDGDEPADAPDDTAAPTTPRPRPVMVRGPEA